MLTTRRPLAEINANRARGSDLSSFERGQIVALKARGDAPAIISRHLGFTPSTVKTTIQRDPLRFNGALQPRPGRPTILDARDKRAILRAI